MRKLGVLLAILALTVSCGRSRLEKLSDRAEAYNRSLRWSSLTAAGLFIDERERRSLLERVSAEMARNKIVDYSIVDMSMDSEKKSGSILVEFSYYGVTDQNLRYRQEVQNWTYNAAKREWFLSGMKTLSEGAPPTP